ncbi:MAG: NADH-quinone oxidoreductase subunit NuoF [Firmicutes bacterium]|jgi:NADH-quinone oxidoreductase subunit F|nr:NADH-quinone oxidoreductase subunit NuoF [Bacillota bacterium]
MIKTAARLAAIRQEKQAALAKEKQRVLICAGTGCVANGSLKVYEELCKAVAEKGLSISVELESEENHSACSSEKNTAPGIAIKKSGCHGFCEKGPLVRIEPEGTLYVGVRPEDVADIATALAKKEVVERLLYRHPNTQETFALEEEIPFYRQQMRVALGNCGVIDPENIWEYIVKDGYAALAKALTEMSPEEVCNSVIESGLRGRGGGGFPTGRKWLLTRQAAGKQKYVICNGDEGDPGAFMDRSAMEGDPHRVIEGMIIAGYAIGADQGYVYMRAEYPLAVHRMQKALDDARGQGLLGEDILGSGFDFDITIMEGAGAFVCGEESALMASIEGKRGMPRPKPPFPAESGLWGCPTLINNVETFANIPPILIKGPAWFRGIGSSSSPGTKTFAITGEVANTGLIEVPMGKTLREIVFDIGGGIRNNGKFKAVQIGGPSGGCLTAEHLDLPLDFDSLRQVGAMIGSGGLVVMDEKTCIVEVARFFMNFTQNESCGKCVLCREGTRRMLGILQRIVDGEGALEDLDALQEIGEAVQEGSLCGLGKTAPNPVLTTMKYFREEYLAHVVEHRCPAGVCQGLKQYVIDPDKCKGCSKCARVCPVGAISGKVKEPFVIDPEKCIKCGACMEACRFGAVEEVA